MRKESSHTSDRPQGEFLAFAGYQVADDKDFFSGRDNSHRSRRKQFGIRAIVDYSAADPGLQSVTQDLLHLFADADDDPGGPINGGGFLPPPVRKSSTVEARVEGVQPVHGDYERNSQVLRKQSRCVTAGQRSMCMDNIDRLRAVQFPYSSDKTGVEYLPRA